MSSIQRKSGVSRPHFKYDQVTGNINYSVRVKFKTTYFIRWILNWTRTFTKTDPMPSFAVWVKNSFLTNSMVLILYMTIVFKIPCQKHRNKAFLVLNVGIFILALNSTIGQIRGHWFQIMTTLVSNSSPRISKSDILGLKFKYFYFCTKLCNKTISKPLPKTLK